ncbi:MAG: hypothetical protein ACLSH6_06785 [Limosilactobacillus pontis]
MPKQGQFAKSARRKRVNNFKVRRHQQGQTIAGDQLTDFLLVRFGLTAEAGPAGCSGDGSALFDRSQRPACRG